MDMRCDRGLGEKLVVCGLDLVAEEGELFGGVSEDERALGVAFEYSE